MSILPEKKDIERMRGICPIHEIQAAISRNQAIDDCQQAVDKELKRLSERDCNAKVQLCYKKGINPFAREDLKIVDVGVSDNTYVVESEVLNKMIKAVEKVCDEEKIHDIIISEGSIDTWSGSYPSYEVAKAISTHIKKVLKGGE